MFGLDFLRRELAHELSAARCQLRRLETLGARLVNLDLETDTGRDMAHRALIRLAQLQRAARQYVERIERDLEALTT